MNGKTVRRWALSLMVGACAALVCGAKAPVWEEVDTAPGPVAAQVLELPQGGAEQPSVQVAVADGSVYVWTARPVTLKLFSILGQLVTQKEVGAGLHRLTLSSRGIYILRAGALTRRIAL